MIVKPDLDSHSEIPLYRQLSRHFAELIASGKLGVGERLPATRELAGLLRLNRTTVSAAYERLEADGLIAGQVGRGSFVTGTAESKRDGPNWDSALRPVFAVQPPPSAPLFGGVPLSFANSRPSEKLFPLDDFRESAQEVMDAPDFSSVLQLGSPGGYEPLRQFLLAEARREGTAGPEDDLLMANGCQQALDLIGTVLVGPGDRVALEDPVFPGLKNVFLQAGAALSGVPVGREGMEPDQLDRVIANGPPKLLMIIPNFQNPTGATIPLAARQLILRAARDAGSIIVENDIYGPLRYEGEALPTLKQMDESGRTVLLRSFSKIAFPGLRVGWVIGPRPLIARLTQAKQLCDLHTGQFSQAVLLRFAQSGRMARHQARMLQAGAERLGAVLRACEKYLPKGARFSRPQGGMNVWVTLPEPLDAAEILPRAQREGVTYLPGRFFGVARTHSNELRLSFAGLTPEQIDRGVGLLGKVFAGELEARRASDREPALAMV
ncbi:MAG: PLP-dependent aminotransferase family protein [Acidobacteriota bacterium]|nr:PLP-dependent aminotransferase family protein [Acidobacteriota bacterium]